MTDLNTNVVNNTKKRDRFDSYKESLELYTNGVFATDLDSLTTDGKMINMFAAQQTQILSVIVSAARCELKNAPDWVAWASEELGLQGSYLHHLRKVGDCLLSVKATFGDKFYKRLFLISYDKLICLAKINIIELSNFSNVHRVESMTRDEVRKAVNAWLHLDAGAEVAEQPLLPGLDDIISFYDQVDQLTLSRTFTAAAANPVKSEKVGTVGLCLVSAALKTLRENAATSLEQLHNLKAGMLEEIGEIDTALANLYTDAE